MGILFFLLGLCFGSFANVCIYRLPNKKSIVFPGSHCPKCNKPIAGYDNIPLLSWLLLGGKCRSCRAPISPRYFIVELLSGLLFFFLFGKFGLTPALIVPLLLVLVLIIVSFIDMDTFLIPVVLTRPLAVVGIVAAFFVPDYYVYMNGREAGLTSLIGLAVGAGSLFLIAFFGKLAFKKDAMGDGDIELIAMIGACLGWKSVFLSVFFGSILGTVISLTLIGLKIKKMDDYVPFGPYLSLGALIALFWKGWTFMGFLIP